MGKRASAARHKPALPSKRSWPDDSTALGIAIELFDDEVEALGVTGFKTVM
jgi:hypothetical protein